MSRAKENTGFICEQCGARVLPLNNGSYRNHCPFCLASKHVDRRPGDRASTCGGLMPAVAIRHKPGKGMQIIHRCLRCGHEQRNRVADDTLQPDDIEQLIRLMG